MKYLLTLIAFFCFAPFTYAAVAYDTSAQGSSFSGTTVNATITVASNSNRILTASMNSTNATGRHVTGITYTSGSGGAWALVTNAKTNIGNREAETWYSIAPSTGSVTIQVTFDGTIDGQAVVFLYSFYNADQTTGVDNGFNGFNTNPVTIGGQAGSMFVIGAESNTAFLAFSGAATVSDQQQVFVEWTQSTHGAGASPNVSLDWTPSGGSRGYSGANIKAAATSARARFVLWGRMFLWGRLIIR